MPGRSCTREIRPVPIAPILIWLLGAFAPSTDAGTIDGKPAATDEARRPPPVVAMNSRRDVPRSGLSVIAISSVCVVCVVCVVCGLCCLCCLWLHLEHQVARVRLRLQHQFSRQ